MNVANRDNEHRDSIWVGWDREDWTGPPIIIDRQIIHLRMTNKGGYNFIIYDDNEMTKRHELWEILNKIRSKADQYDWLVAGDFIEILLSEDMDRVGQLDQVGTGEFRDVVNRLT